MLGRRKGAGLGLSKTRGGDTASGGSGVSPPLQLSHRFCFVLLKLLELDSTYPGELIMTDLRRRPLVLNLGRTVVLHNLHFVHYLPRKIQILLREQCDKNAEDNKSMKSKQFRLISAATLYQASGWAGRGWPAGRSSSPVQQLDPRTPARQLQCASDQRAAAGQFPAASCGLSPALAGPSSAPSR